MLWEFMEVTRDLKSFLASVLPPEREEDGSKSQKRHGGRKMSRWYMVFLSKCVETWLAGGKTRGQQTRLLLVVHHRLGNIPWTHLHPQVEHGSMLTHRRAQVEKQ